MTWPGLAAVLWPLQVETRNIDHWLEITAWVTALVFILSVVVAIAVLRYRGIDSEQRRHLYAIRPQLYEAKPKRVTVKRADGFAAVKPRMQAFFDRQATAPTDVGVRDATRTLVSTVRAGLPNAPRLAVRGAIEGAVILGIGVLLAVSAEWIRWLLAPDPDFPGREVVLWMVQWLPSWDLLLAVALVAVMVFWGVATTFWWLFGLALVVGAVVLTDVDRRTREDLSVTLFPGRLRVVTRCVVAMVAALVAAAVPNAVLTTAGFDTAGTVVGAVLGLVVVSVTLAYGVLALGTALVERQSLPDSNTRAVALYLLIRKSFGVLAVLSLPVAGWMVWRGVRASVTWAESSPLLAAVAVVVVVLVTVLLSWVLLSDEVRQVMRALGDWLRSTKVRGWLFARGIPVTAMVFAFLFAWSFGLTMSLGSVPILSGAVGVWPAVLVALFVGAVVRVVTFAWTTAKHRFVRFRRRLEWRRSAVVGLYPPIEDADGDVLYVARVEDHELAHRDIEKLLTDTETVVQAALDGESQPPVTESRYYWKDIRFGTVDLDQVRRELSGDCRSRLLATVIDNGGAVEREVIDEELAKKYPEDAVREAKIALLSRGDISREDGRYHYHG